MGLFGKKSDSPIVCKCKKISEKAIIEAIKNGADTVEKVKVATGARTGMCDGKRCTPEIEKIINANK